MARDRQFLKGASSAVIVVIIIVAVAALFLLSPQIFRGGGSGGLVGTVGSGTQGVVITSFSPEVSIIDVGGTSVLYTIALENRGEQDALNVVAKIIGGLGSDTPASKTKEPVAGGINSIKLSGQDASKGLKGDTTTGDWSVTVPEQKDADNPYTTTARVTYSYTTVSEIVLRVVNQDFLRSSGSSSSSQTSGIVSSKTTLGPFSVTATAPRVTIQSGQEAGSVRVQYVIENIGGGRPYKDSVKIENLDLVDISVSSSDSGVSEIKCGDSTQRIPSTTKSKTISCDVTVTGVTNFKEFPITLKLSYNYFVDSTTTITVLKKLPGTSGSVTLTAEQQGYTCTVNSQCSADSECPQPAQGKTQKKCFTSRTVSSGKCCFK